MSTDSECLRDWVQLYAGRSHRVTDAMRDVLTVIADTDPGTPAWGLSICEATGRGPGDVYPALDRLMKAGLITDQWEDPPPADRLRRRLYHPAFDAIWYRQARLLPATPPPNGETP